MTGLYGFRGGGRRVRLMFITGSLLIFAGAVTRIELLASQRLGMISRFIRAQLCRKAAGHT